MLDITKLIMQASPLQEIKAAVFDKYKIRFYLKRDDLLHPLVSGNKWRKLKYNLMEMSKLGVETVLTFGGAFSNHIYSVAAAGKACGFKTIGIIRGEELNQNSNDTLKFAATCGMNLIFVSRMAYNNKELLAQIYGKGAYLLPEGGTNQLALRGVSEMVPEIIEQLGYKPNYIATAVGSGGTLAGICSAYYPEIMPLGINVVGQKQAKITNEYIENLLHNANISKYNCSSVLGITTGSYGKANEDLINFIKKFEEKHNIQLEQVYTAKLIYTLLNLIEQAYFSPNTTIVAIHTGGLQGRLKHL